MRLALTALCLAPLGTSLGTAFATPLPVPDAQNLRASPACGLCAQDDSADLSVQVRTPAGAPLKGARITLTWDLPEKAVQVIRTRADPTGNFDCLVPRDKPITWIVKMPEPGQSKSGTLIIPLDRAAETLTVSLHSGDDATYTTIFVDEDTREPIPAVIVQRLPVIDPLPFAHPVKPPADSPTEPTTRGDRFGEAQVPAATWRPYQLLVFADGYAYTHLTVGGAPDAPGLDAPRRVPLQEEATLQITLLDSTADHWVRASASLYSPGRSHLDLADILATYVTFHSMLSGAEGEHVVRGVPARSNVHLHLMRGEQEIRELERLVTGGPGEATRRTYDCWNRGVIEGTLAVSKGHSAEGRAISLVRVSGSSKRRRTRRSKVLGTTTTNPSGAFSFGSLSVGNYYVFIADESAADQVSEDVFTAIDSDKPRVEVAIHEIAGVYVAGSLFDENGAPYNGPISASGTKTDCRGRADASGKFRLGPFFPKETVDLRATTERQRWMSAPPESIKVTAPVEDLKIHLQPAGKLEGRVEGVPPTATSRATVIELRAGAQLISLTGAVQIDGTFSLGNIPPGKYMATASLMGRKKSAAVEVEIQGGKVTSGVVFELPPN